MIGETLYKKNSWSKMSSRGRSKKTTKKEDLPKEVITACCTNNSDAVREWLEKCSSIDACSGLADLLQGANVEARFHGGEIIQNCLKDNPLNDITLLH